MEILSSSLINYFSLASDGNSFRPLEKSFILAKGLEMSFRSGLDLIGVNLIL